MKKRNNIIRKNKSIMYIIFLVFLIVILLTLTSLTIYTYTVIHVKEVDKSIIYNERAKLDYSVCLKKNEFIEQECINEKRSFVATLIDKININLSYQLDSSDLADFEYIYSIKTTTLATERGEEEKILYTKEKILKEGSLKKNSTNLLTLNEEVSLNYQEYNDLITSFKKNYVLAIDSTLLITATINIKGENEYFDENINTIHTMNITMPLAEQTVNIISDNDTIENKDTLTKYKDKSKGYKKYYIYLDILYKLDGLYIIFIIYLFLKFVPRRDAYNKKVSKILKNYDDIIVTVKKMPIIKGLISIELSNFNELLDAHQALNKPIIYFKPIHNEYSAFMIVTEKEVYEYILYSYQKVKDGKK